MNETLQEYFDALERLKSNHPINVPRIKIEKNIKKVIRDENGDV